MKPPELAHKVIAFLNELLKVDPEAMTALVETRVPCNQALREHPTVQVAVNDETGQAAVGMLGILNGLVGVDDDGWGFVTVKLDDNKQVTEFLLTPPRYKR